MKVQVENWWGGEPTTYDVKEIRIIVKVDLNHQWIEETEEWLEYPYLYEDDHALLILKDGTEKKVHRDYLPKIKKEKIN